MKSTQPHLLMPLHWRDGDMKRRLKAFQKMEYSIVKSLPTSLFQREELPLFGKGRGEIFFALNSAIIALFLLVLSGCASMAPNYTRPKAPVPSEWPGGSAYKAGAAGTGERSAADITWQEFFVDTKLQKLITLALENNRDLRIAGLNIEKTQALYRIQRAELLPSVNAGATFSKERVPGILSGTGA